MRYIISLCCASLTLSAAFAEVPRVVTDIPPVHSLVAQVMGDLGTPELLLEAGADEHSFQLRPSQAAALNNAALVFWVGPELTPWLDRALESVPASVLPVALLHAEGTVLKNYAEADHDGEDAHDHAAEEPAKAEHAEGAHEHADEHADEHDHDHAGLDPHAWLAPGNAANWVGIIAAELSRVDPENAATYAENALRAKDTIASANATATATLAPVSDRAFMVYHDAFGYFSDAFGLSIAGTIAAGDAATPGAARIADMQAMITAGAVVCVFPEVQHDPALLDQILGGSPARKGGELDPVGSSLEPGPQMYAAWLTGTASTIADCLSAD